MALAIDAYDKIEAARLVATLCDPACRPRLTRIPRGCVDNAHSLVAPRTFLEWATGRHILLEDMWRARFARIGTLRTTRDTPYLIWLPALVPAAHSGEPRPNKVGALLQVVHTSDGRVIHWLTSVATAANTKDASAEFAALRVYADHFCARVLYPCVRSWSTIDASDTARIQVEPPSVDDCDRCFVHVSGGTDGDESDDALRWWAQQVHAAAAERSRASVTDSEHLCARADHALLATQLALDYALHVRHERTSLPPRSDLETSVVTGQLAFQVLLEAATAAPGAPLICLLPETTRERLDDPHFVEQLTTQARYAVTRGAGDISALVVPLNGHYHWTLLVYRLRDKRFLHYDSLLGKDGSNGGSVHHGLVTDVLQAITDGFDDVLLGECRLRTVRFPAGQTQEGNQCGLYVLALVRALVEGPLLQGEHGERILATARALVRAFYDNVLSTTWSAITPTLVLRMLARALPVLLPD